MPRVSQLVTVLAIIATTTSAAVAWFVDSDPGVPIEILPAPTTLAPSESAPTGITAHISGAVARPGVYSAKDGDRLADLVALAGGATQGADLNAVNLATRVQDAAQYCIPGADASCTIAIASPEPVEAVGGKININSADTATLETLPGIGEVKAAAIVQFRLANGAFSRVDDILAVRGIGTATLEGIRDLIAVR